MNKYTVFKCVLNAQNPLIFLSLMLSVLAVILSVWLIACGLLLDLPLIANTPFSTLGFVFGFVWGFFASSWALLVVMQPNLTHFASFSHVLLLHLQGAPVLYALHFLCLVAIICWSYCLLRGMMARTTGHTKTAIQISAVLAVLFLVVFIVDLLFSDVITTACQPPYSSASGQRTWFGWLSGSTATVPPSISSPQEMATNIANIMHNSRGEAAAICQGLDEAAYRLALESDPKAVYVKNQAVTCHEVTKLFDKSFHSINLEVARLPTDSMPQSGIQRGLQTVTEKVLTPAAEIAIQGALRGAGESMVEIAAPR